MNKVLAYTEMIAVVETGSTPVSNLKLVGSGTVVGVSLNLLEALSPDTVAHASLNFFSTNNPGGTPLGSILSGPISRLSGLRWDGQILMLPDMALSLILNSTDTCKATASILVEHERKE